MTRITKAIFPVAGLGTRFLPVTKAIAKEMLPIVDKPLVQYAVEEAIEAGITDMIFVTNALKGSIMDYFDRASGLEQQLYESGKQELLQLLLDIVPTGISFAFIRQTEALGLGHAVLCSEPLVGNEAFAVVLPDDLIYAPQQGCLSAMIDLTKHETSVIAIQEVAHSLVNQYGVINPHKFMDRAYQVKSIVEKPPLDQAPSNLAVVGRYILQPYIFELLKQTKARLNGEIQLTDAIALLLKNQTVLGHQFVGTRYDCGSKLGFLKANVEYALRDQYLKDDFQNYLQKLCSCFEVS